MIVPDGKPVIGSVPGLQNLYLAAGHEGGGLSMVSKIHTNVLNLSQEHDHESPVS